MFERVVTLFAALTVCDATMVDRVFAQRAPGGVSSDREKSIPSGRPGVPKRPKLWMWLIDEDIPFFRDNLATLEPALQEALSNSDEDIRKDAACVIARIGPPALSLEPTLVQRIDADPSRFVRIHLYGAARSIGAQSANMLAALRTRFANLEKEPDGLFHENGYTATDERFEVAHALLKLDDDAARKAQCREFLLRWLKPAPENLSGMMLEDYWSHCWVAVNAVETTGGPREAIPLLEAMLKDPHRKAWVSMRVSALLSVLDAPPLADPVKAPPLEDRAKTSTKEELLTVPAAPLIPFGLTPNAPLPGNRGDASIRHRMEFPKRKLTVSCDDGGEVIVVNRADQEKRLRAPVKSYWSQLAFTPDGLYIFALANTRTVAPPSLADSIHRIRLPSESEALEATSQERLLPTTGLRCPGFKDAFVTQLCATSKDGKRLLVMAGYTETFNSSSGRVYVDFRPFFLDVDSKTLSAVMP
jgi:hypothetical protein